MRILDQLLKQLEREGTVCGSVVSVVGGVRGALVWWAGSEEHSCVVGRVRGAPMCGGRGQGSTHVWWAGSGEHLCVCVKVYVGKTVCRKLRRDRLKFQ